MSKPQEFDASRYWEDRLTRNCGLHGVGYAGLGLAYNSWLYRVRRHVVLRTLGDLNRDCRALRVLDVGSGTGFYLDLFRAVGVVNLVGCDFTAAATRALRERFADLEIVKADIAGDLGPLAGRSFDLASAFDVLFHIVDDTAFERAVGAIASLLVPGGIFLFSDNFLHGKEVRYAHQVNRRKEHIEAVLRGAGFRVVERRPMFCLMNYPVDTHLTFTRLAWRLMMRLVGIHETVGFVAGAALYPLEILCLRFLREGPSTELAICEKGVPPP